MRPRPLLARPLLARPLLALPLFACALALAACDRGADPPKPVAAPAPARPLAYARSTSDAELSLKVPGEVAAVPALYDRLFGEGRQGLEAFAVQAKQDLDERRALDNGAPIYPYARSLDYALAANTPRLIGLSLTEFANTGGAHPNTRLAGLIWDKAEARFVEPSALFQAGADLAAADKALCDAIRAAKQARTGEVSFLGAEVEACPTLMESSLTLAPSTEPARAGGLVALFSPYRLGPYAEGGYRIVVPNAALQGVIAEPYRGEFAGAPAPDAGADPSGT